MLPLTNIMGWGSQVNTIICLNSHVQVSNKTTSADMLISELILNSEFNLISQDITLWLRESKTSIGTITFSQAGVCDTITIAINNGLNDWKLTTIKCLNHFQKLVALVILLSVTLNKLVKLIQAENKESKCVVLVTY